MTLGSSSALASGAILPQASAAMVLWNDYSSWDVKSNHKSIGQFSAALAADQTTNAEKILTRALRQHHVHPHSTMSNHRSVEKRKLRSNSHAWALIGHSTTSSTSFVSADPWNVNQNNQATNGLSVVERGGRPYPPVQSQQNRSKAQKSSQQSSFSAPSTASSSNLGPTTGSLPVPPYYAMNARPVSGGKGRLPMPDLSGFAPAMGGSHGQLEYGFYGREYGRGHFPLAPVHQDTSVNWHSLLQLILLALMATGGTIGSIFIISSLTVIESFQIRGKVGQLSDCLVDTCSQKKRIKLI